LTLFAQDDFSALDSGGRAGNSGFSTRDRGACCSTVRRRSFFLDAARSGREARPFSFRQTTAPLTCAWGAWVGAHKAQADCLSWRGGVPMSDPRHPRGDHFEALGERSATRGGVAARKIVRRGREGAPVATTRGAGHIVFGRVDAASPRLNPSGDAHVPRRSAYLRNRRGSAELAGALPARGKTSILKVGGRLVRHAFHSLGARNFASSRGDVLRRTQRSGAASAPCGRTWAEAPAKSFPPLTAEPRWSAGIV